MLLKSLHLQVIFHSNLYTYRLYSTQIFTLTYHIPLKSLHLQVIFHSNLYTYRLYFIQIFTLTGYISFKSLNLQVIFHSNIYTHKFKCITKIFTPTGHISISYNYGSYITQLFTLIVNL